MLCPNEGGAFKQTVNGEWVHLLCAIWVPETRVANEVFMEPVTGVEKINKQRWKLVSLKISGGHSPLLTSLDAEMFPLWGKGRGVYPMQQNFVLLGFPHNPREEGEALNAHEECTWCRTHYVGLLLQEASPCT